MDVTLENKDLVVKVRSKGAELFSVFNRDTGLDYMWGGDPAFWGKTSPVLFPIVGTLKDDKFIFEGNGYALSRHGFARDASFEVTTLADDKARFTLKSDEGSLKKYPFSFSLAIVYSLKDNFLHVEYSVENNGTGDMYFSLGAHPAFKVPLMEATRYEDYYLEFNIKETASRWPISTKGLIEEKPIPFLNHSDRIALSKKLFFDDAIVLKHLSSNCISLKSAAHSHGLDFYYDGFPYIGLWAAPNADFVCIEPWCGIADSVNHDQNFTTKEGIEKIGPASSWSRMWKVRFY
ncbi:MAG TPA: aldose 1-epimerase family protein [Chryseolinea sp.]